MSDSSRSPSRDHKIRRERKSYRDAPYRRDERRASSLGMLTDDASPQTMFLLGVLYQMALLFFWITPTQTAPGLSNKSLLALLFAQCCLYVNSLFVLSKL